MKKTIDEDKDIKMTLCSLREHIYFTPTFKNSGHCRKGDRKSVRITSAERLPENISF